MGDGVSSTVYTLADFGGSIVAGGVFAQAGDSTVNYITYWDGVTWNPMGSGMEDWVWSLKVHNGSLFAGGMFTAAGGKGSGYIARWDGGLVSVPYVPIGPSGLTLASGYPNPFVSTTTIRYNLPARGIVSLGIYDVLGRRVATLAEGDKPAGWNSVVWSGLDARGNPVPAGVYFARIKHGGHTEAQKITLVR
jgi:hypothetical protein